MNTPTTSQGSISPSIFRRRLSPGTSPGNCSRIDSLTAIPRRSPGCSQRPATRMGETSFESTGGARMVRFSATESSPKSTSAPAKAQPSTSATPGTWCATISISLNR